MPPLEAGRRVTYPTTGAGSAEPPWPTKPLKLRPEKATVATLTGCMAVVIAAPAPTTAVASKMRVSIS